ELAVSDLGCCLMGAGNSCPSDLHKTSFYNILGRGGQLCLVHHRKSHILQLRLPETKDSIGPYRRAQVIIPSTPRLPRSPISLISSCPAMSVCKDEALLCQFSPASERARQS